MSSAKLSGDKKISKLLAAEKLGEEIAKRLIKMGIKRVAFDRSGFRYHGRVKAVAEGVRKGGIII
jgi:large subunit ribosomal protein L18